MKHTLTCTFCKKSEHQVRKLVAGPGVYICDACVEIAHRIVHESEPPVAEPRAFGPGLLQHIGRRLGRLRRLVTRRIDLATA